MDGQLVWFVAFLLYAYDSVSFEKRDAVLRYSLDGVTAKITTPSIKVGTRRIFIPNPLRPDRCDLILDASRDEPLSLVDMFFIRRASSLYVVHQAVAVGTLVSLFGLTPLLATRMNLLYACMIAVAVTYWLCLIHWLAMWFDRRLLGVNGKKIRSDVVHVLLCPPNAVNCARRIAELRRPRYGVVPCLRAFARLDAEKYEEEFKPFVASPA